MDASIIAYLAGFVDGEGCIAIHRNHNGSFFLTLSASQVNPYPLRLLAYHFTGSVRIDKSTSRLGKKRLYTWKVMSDRASNALKALLPFLVVKKDEAGLGIEFQDTVKGKHRRLTEGDKYQEERYYMEMRSLKKREY